MTLTTKYELEIVNTGATNWHAVISTNMEKLDEFINTFIPGIAGENLAFAKAVYLKSDRKFWLAKADSETTMPAMGLVANPLGVLANEPVLVQRVGIITNSNWSLTRGGRVWLSAGTAGGITQTKPGGGLAQSLGVANGIDNILMNVIFIWI
jgi:hypothetical protein